MYALDMGDFDELQELSVSTLSPHDRQFADNTLPRQITDLPSNTPQERNRRRRVAIAYQELYARVTCARLDQLAEFLDSIEITGLPRSRSRSRSRRQCSCRCCRRTSQCSCPCCQRRSHAR
jgi:hypothetical protein